MSFSIASSDSNVLMSADILDLKMLSLQMAASVLDNTKTMPTSGDPTQGAGLVLSQYVNWADHGYTNHLQTMVEFLYAAIPVLSQIKFLFENKELDLIKDAMTAYQGYKTNIVKESQAVHGQNFGSATGFVRKDWTDRNSLL